MRELISDRKADTNTEIGLQDSTTFAGLASDACSAPLISNVGARREAEPLSDVDKLVILVQFYLELRLEIRQAWRAAEADLMTSFKAQNRRPT